MIAWGSSMFDTFNPRVTSTRCDRVQEYRYPKNQSPDIIMYGQTKYIDTQSLRWPILVCKSRILTSQSYGKPENFPAPKETAPIFSTIDEEIRKVIPQRSITENFILAAVFFECVTPQLDHHCPPPLITENKLIPSTRPNTTCAPFYPTECCRMF